MSEQQTGPELLAELSKGEGSDAEIALEFLLRIGVKARGPVQMLVPIVAPAVTNVRRSHTRGVERSVFQRGKRSLGVVIDTVALREKLLREPFALGDGRRVEWGAAVEDEHQEHIDILLPIYDGVGETIREHEEAIKLIRDHGVTCLDEIEPSGEEAA